MRLLPATLLCLAACSAREAPQPQPRARPAPVVPQGRTSVDDNAPFEGLEVQLRTGRTRVGEAVRLHVSAWRASDAPGFSPSVELIGPATIERVGDEIVEERDGKVRERIDFVIEPSEPGQAELTVLDEIAGDPAVQRHDLTLLIGEAMAEAELAKLLASASGRLERGRALAKQGDYRRAIEVFNLALEHRRDDPIVLGELGWAAFLAGDETLARRATREALRHQTDDRARGSLLYNLGRIAEALGREDEAIAAYRRSLEVRPDSAPVRARLDKLEAGRPAPTCAAPSCPLTSPIEPIRACELIEEEACPLFRQRSACHCDAEALRELEAIGRWRLLTLAERHETGINQIYVLLIEAEEQRYQVFRPLPGSHFHGELRGGVRSAELIQTGELELLRIDFEGTVDRSSLPSEPDADGLARGWTLLCAVVGEGPVCAAPLLTSYQASGEARLVAPLQIDDDRVQQTIESGAAPSRNELDLEFPGAGMQVLAKPIAITDLLK